MKTLYEAIEAGGSPLAPYLIKHLASSGITKWEDCTKSVLSEFVTNLSEQVCQSSAKTYVAVLKAVLNRYIEDAPIPCKDMKSALKCKGEKCQKTYLNEDELRMLESVRTRKGNERFVQLCFLISARTGMRVSDALRVNGDNVVNGVLTYVSQKTSIEASVPVSDKVLDWIREANEITQRPCLVTYERTIRRLCERAGIDSPVKVFKAGKEQTLPKYEFVSSHTARVSFASILASKNIPIRTIMRMLGHENESTTERYIAYKGMDVTPEAEDFFNF